MNKLLLIATLLGFASIANAVTYVNKVASCTGVSEGLCGNSWVAKEKGDGKGYGCKWDKVSKNCNATGANCTISGSSCN